MRLLPANFYIDIPEELSQEVDACDDRHVSEIGIAWAVKQAGELISAGVPCLHFYIMKTAKHAKQVVARLRQYA